ncbi:ATP-binding protein [Bdellovibrio sp. NC01]|uniref:ATP-binding protein n=1 Tax=Bdellovibrio sp. NC01 TaxID=2220073 RepID=UPI00115730DA|nr:ATP-binding protein [Bdellovibrio sp. NC01]QDK37422.1 nitrogen fixation protein FixL [Bdellovibrio sp. NC01]
MSLASFIRKLPKLHNVLALIVLGVGLTVIFGWIVQDPMLIRVRPQFAPMVFNSAFLLCFLSLGVLFSEYSYLKLGRICSVIVMIFSGVVLIQYPLNINFGIDTFFVKPFFDSNYPGRMAASVAGTTALLGLALFFNKRSTLCQYVRSTASSLAFGFGVIGLLGYVFNFNSEYGWGSFSRMAVHTSTSIILLSIALLAQLRTKVKEQSDNIEGRYFIPFYMLIIGILTSLLIWQLLVVKDFDRNRGITEIRAESLKTNMDNTLYPVKTSLENMARRFALHRYPNYEVWALDSASFIEDFGGIKRVTWADENYVTRWVYPLTNGGEKIKSVNVSEEPTVRDIVKYAVENRTMSMSSTFELKTGGSGFVIFAPIFREDQFQGILSAAVIAKDFFERIAKVENYDLTIYEDGRELISTGKAQGTYARDWTYKTTYRYLNAKWEIELTPKPELIRANASVLPSFVFIFGVTISLLLSLAVHFFQKAKKAESKARQSLEWQNAARNSISLIVFTTDADIKILDVNDAMVKLLGYSVEELVGTSPYAFHDHDELMMKRGQMEARLGRPLPTDRDFAEAIFELGYSSASERTLLTKSGKRLSTVASISRVVGDNGEIAGYMAIFEDITQKKERENLLKEQEKLIMTSSRLASLGEMAAGIAHEINNPLAIISGYVSVLKKQLSQKGLDGDVEINRRVDSIDSTVQRIAKIIRGLRTYSRESHEGSDEVSSVDQIIDDTLAFCTEKFRNDNIDLVASIEPNLKVRCRPYQISQVILNLLNNAYDAVAQSQVRKVVIEAKKVSDGIEISVTDSGPGVPKELRSKIMQPFFTTKEVGQGIGLGLSISQGIIQSHGGKFYLDETSKQTRFVIWLKS